MASVAEDVFKCVLSGDLAAVTECLGRAELSEEETCVFGVKDEVGRSALLSASLLGRSAIVRELLRHGAHVNEHTVRGYSSLHLAACWGHLDTVRTLLELGADVQAETFRGDRPVTLATRYCHADCADCLMLEEAKQDLMSYVAFVKDLICDPERNLTKEEKNTCTRVCSAKSDWIQSSSSSTASDFTAQRRDMEESLQPILSKLSAQCE